MIEIRDLEFHYRSGGFSLRVPEFDVANGETVALIGPSGTGKTTLLNLVAGCDVPHSGRVTTGDRVLSLLSDAERREYRIRNLGLVFQEFELLSYLSVQDNILLPYRLTGAQQLDEAANERARQLANRAGIADKLARRADRLSQGERQRVAVCRALVTEPRALLCDEPTGNLDPDNTKRVLEMLLEYTSAHEATLVSVTHDHGLLAHFSRTVDIREITTSP